MGHDAPAAIFNSLELAKIVDERDCTIQVCDIQSNKIVVAGYLNGSTKTMEEQHFTGLLNTVPNLKGCDVEVKMMNVPNPTTDATTPYNPRDQVIAAHILCAEKDEEEVNRGMTNVYNKKRKRTRCVYPEARKMNYVPFQMTGKIMQTPKRYRQLQKNRLTHAWYQARHHGVPFTGFSNIHKILEAPNGTKFTLCQVIMSTKCSDDFITPMFVAVDELATGEVIITCDIGMKPEAEAFLSHFGVYAAYIFGSVVWEAFTVGYKMQMSDFQFCPIKGCAVEIDNSTVGTTESTDIEFAKCGLSEDLLIMPEVISFDPKNQITLHLAPDTNGLLGDENGDSGTIRTDCSDATLGTFKTALSAPIDYLVPRSTTTTFSTTAPPQIPTNDTSNDDALMMPASATTSTEENLNNRSDGPDKD